MPKPYAKLKREDFESTPVWTWSPDDDGDGAATPLAASDESFVQPTPHATIPRHPFAQFIVAARYELRDGTPMPGFAEVTVADDRVAVQPTTVFLLDRHLRVPGVETNRLLSRYTKSPGNHPAHWTLNVCVDGEATPRAGTIQGGDMKDIVAAGMAVLESLKSLRK